MHGTDSPRDERFFQTGCWVQVEDLYDHETVRFGPFPDAAAAAEFCDAWNGRQLHPRPGATPTRPAAATDLGVWELATTDGYDWRERLTTLAGWPAGAAPDPDEVRARHGARPEHEWRRLLHERVVPERCYCRALVTGERPAARPEEIAAHVMLRLLPRRALFGTEPSHGDAAIVRCQVCGGSLLHLAVERPGFGEPAAHDYVPLDGPALQALSAGALGPATLEAWVRERARIHREGWQAWFAPPE